MRRFIIAVLLHDMWSGRIHQSEWGKWEMRTKFCRRTSWEGTEWDILMRKGGIKVDLECCFQCQELDSQFGIGSDGDLLGTRKLAFWFLVTKECFQLLSSYQLSKKGFSLLRYLFVHKIFTAIGSHFIVHIHILMNRIHTRRLLAFQMPTFKFVCRFTQRRFVNYELRRV